MARRRRRSVPPQWVEEFTFSPPLAAFNVRLSTFLTRHNAKNGNMPGRNLGEIYSNVVLFDGADPVRILLIQKSPAVVMSNVWQLPGG